MKCNIEKVQDLVWYGVLASFCRILTVCGAIVLMVLALAPSLSTSELPSTGWDKTNHLASFVLLGLWGSMGWTERKILVLKILLAYGGLIEVLQFFTPDRTAEWEDLLADAMGLGVGAGIAIVIGHIKYWFSNGRIDSPSA